MTIDIGKTSDGYHTFDELYEHRVALFMALMICNPEISWKSLKHADGSDYPDWFIAGMHLSSGAITYHLPVYKWEMLAGIKTLENAPKWDGHTASDVVARLEGAEFAGEQREELSTWMISAGFSTGHGDTMDDLLEELEWQIEEIRGNNAETRSTP